VHSSPSGMAAVVLEEVLRRQSSDAHKVELLTSLREFGLHLHDSASRLWRQHKTHCNSLVWPLSHDLNLKVCGSQEQQKVVQIFTAGWRICCARLFFPLWCMLFFLQLEVFHDIMVWWNIAIDVDISIYKKNFSISHCFIEFCDVLFFLSEENLSKFPMECLMV
jgi:hypothetical protein